MILKTQDIFQSGTTQFGEIVAVERVDAEEVGIWINGHKGSFTPEEAWAFTNAIREMIRLDLPRMKKRFADRKDGGE